MQQLASQIHIRTTWYKTQHSPPHPKTIALSHTVALLHYQPPPLIDLLHSTSTYASTQKYSNTLTPIPNPFSKPQLPHPCVRTYNSLTVYQFYTTLKVQTIG